MSFNYVVASHVLGSDSVSFYEKDCDRIQTEVVTQLPPMTEVTKADILIRLQSVMLRAPRELDCLVLVNPGYIDMDTVSAAFSQVDQRARTVKCICAVQARLLAAITTIDNVPTDSEVLIVTAVDGHQEIHVVNKTKSCYHYVDRTLCLKKVDAEIRRFQRMFPKAKIVLVRRQHTFLSRNSILPGINIDSIYDITSWHQMLALGGLTEGRTSEDGKYYKIRHVAPFSLGLTLFEVETNKSIEICKYGAKTPFAATRETTYTTKLCRFEYSSQLVEINLGKVINYKQIEYIVKAEPEAPQFQVNLDISVLSNGCPLAKLTAIKGIVSSGPVIRIDNSINVPPSSSHAERPSRSPQNTPGIRSTMEKRIPLLDDLKLPPSASADFIVFFGNDIFSFALKDKKRSEFVRRANVNGNMWTPMFISFAQSNIRLGEAAFHDFMQKPTFVIHGLMSLIGKKRIDEIERENNFNLPLEYDDNGDIVIAFQTSDGPRTMSPLMALSFHITAATKEAKRSFPSSPMSRVFFKTLITPTPEIVGVIKQASKIANVTFVGIDIFRQAPEL